VSAEATIASPRAPAERFRVEGMHCASCAGRVERILREQPQVASASVNFATAEARVQGNVDARALRAAIREAGYELVPLRDESLLPVTREVETSRLRFLVAAALTLPVFALAMLGFDAAWSRIAQALLATPIVLACGAPFHRGAWTRARHREANMDTLVSMGTLAAYGASLWALLRGGPVFFESAAVIVTLILLGRWLEARARGRASQAVSELAALAAVDACVLRGGREVRVPIQDLAVGDVLLIRPGEKVPTDAVVEEGRSEIDASMFTGEPLPRACGPGDEIPGAAVNGRGRLIARATRVGRDTALAAILRLVEETQASKAPVERLVDAIAGRFVPVVLAIAAVTLIGWLSAGATGADALTRATQFLERVAAVEAASEHAIGRAIAAGARARGVALEAIEDFEAVPGCGARGRVRGSEVLVGATRWLRECGLEIPTDLGATIDALEARGFTVVVGAWDGRARGALALADVPREDAPAAIAALRRLGVDVHLVTGDNPRAARAAAQALGIEHVVAEARPDEKAAMVAALQRAGQRVAFVGDGINDAPALGQADLGLAVGTGTDVAIESGSAVLVSGDPRLAAIALALARRTYHTIGQNLFWAFAYITAAIPVAALSGLDPMLAAGAMAFSSVSVVTNSLRLRRWSPRV
jgi:Cu+-exporting ATPase